MQIAPLSRKAVESVRPIGRNHLPHSYLTPRANQEGGGGLKGVLTGPSGGKVVSQHKCGKERASEEKPGGNISKTTPPNDKIIVSYR